MLLKLELINRVLEKNDIFWSLLALLKLEFGVWEKSCCLLCVDRDDDAICSIFENKRDYVEIGNNMVIFGLTVCYSMECVTAGHILPYISRLPNVDNSIFWRKHGNAEP